MDARSSYLIVKDVLDRIISLLAIIVLLPLMVIIAIAVKLESDGPVMFVHKRYTKGNKMFKMYKFRTMVKDAEKLKAEFTKEQKEEYEKGYKLKNDPRITKLGKILRTSSLDELPQLFNVLKGDMSLVGPRPIIKEELDRYGKNKKILLSVKPGITGAWATAGRSNIHYKKRMELELNYAANVSFILDVKCFFKTFYIVLKKIGAV